MKYSISTDRHQSSDYNMSTTQKSLMLVGSNSAALSPGTPAGTEPVAFERCDGVTLYEVLSCNLGR